MIWSGFIAFPNFLAAHVCQDIFSYRALYGRLANRCSPTFRLAILEVAVARGPKFYFWCLEATALRLREPKRRVVQRALSQMDYLLIACSAVWHSLLVFHLLLHSVSIVTMNFASLTHTYLQIENCRGVTSRHPMNLTCVVVGGVMGCLPS
jgi:hypothetical protein